MARRLVSRARPLDDRVPPQAGFAAGPGLPGHADRRRVLPPLRGGAEAPSWRILAPLRRPRHDVPQRLAAGTTAAHPRRVAPARAAPDRSVALVPGRRRR